MDDTILSRNDTSIKEKNTVEKDVQGDIDEDLPEMTLIRNDIPSAEEHNVVEKDFTKLEVFGDVEDQNIKRVNEKENEEKDLGKNAAKPGKSGRKELHSSAKVNALSESWDEAEIEITLQVYKLIFTSQCNDEETYSNFALVVKSVLDNDITDTEIDLFLTKDKIVKAKLLPSGEMTLDLNQLRNAKDFQGIIFNGICGNLRNRKIVTEMKTLRCSSYTYLLLPLESDKSGVTAIDWKCIETCAVSAREFISISTISEEDINAFDINNITEVPMVETSHLNRQGKSDNLILASGICEPSNLIDKAVLTVHDGNIYHVVNIIHDTIAKNLVPLTKESKPHHDSYGEDAQKMDGRKRMNLNQPLLLVKHPDRPHNFLTKAQQKPVVNEEKLIKPGRCLNLGVPSSVMRSLCLVPSAMHRLASLLLASQLQKEIREECSNCPPLSVPLIMEALTSRKCLECFSYERLELLGDSFLKYAISQHLFMKYENEDEGQLSARRAEAVCNTFLHRLAVARKLQEYIQDEPFHWSKWVAPGFLCRRIIPCSCNPRDPNSLPMKKVCDKGHRWIYSKKISDVVEALIGAHLVGGGVIAALEFMRWLNIEVDIEDKSVEIALNHHFSYPSVLNTSLYELQSLLCYHFENPCLLVEALTHASIHEHGRCSYERLEFLGDSVLDLLITKHLYIKYQELSPGSLSDLRQVAVNNETFAQVTVKHDIQNYLFHHSDDIKDQIAKFVESVKKYKDSDCQFISFGGGMRAPKVLGDLIESISGAILVDTRLKPCVVWDKLYPILSPIVTPENVVPQPIRELNELCNQQHYDHSLMPITRKGNLFVVTVQIQLGEVSIYGEGLDKNSKFAMTKAAKHALAQLRDKGICHGCRAFGQNTVEMAGNEDTYSSNLIAQEKKIIASSPQTDLGEMDQCHREERDKEEYLLCSNTSMQGVNRKNLNEVCQKMHFSKPNFELIEEIGMPHEKRFLFKVVVKVPNKNNLSIQGKHERDHAHAKDSAAFNMLVELQKHGLCSI